MKEDAVDNQGTGQPEARDMMHQLMNERFGGGGIEHLALVMGRPEDELQRFLTGEEPIDDDFVMKMRGVAKERGVDLG
jgi:hypothetical protein